MIEATVAEFGKLDILYNNAVGSTPRDNTVVDANLEEFWRVVKVDLWGTFLGCRFAIPHMRKNGSGAIVNMLSNVALMGVPGVDCYTSARGGVAALTRSLAVTYAADRIRVNAIAPSTTLSRVKTDRRDAIRLVRRASVCNQKHPVCRPSGNVTGRAQATRRTTGLSTLVVPIVPSSCTSPMPIE